MKKLFLNLTNANPIYRDRPLALRKDLVINVHANTVLRDDGSSELVSFVFLPPHGSWEVLETYDEIMQQLEE
jgi:hypothetical protein